MPSHCVVPYSELAKTKQNETKIPEGDKAVANQASPHCIFLPFLILSPCTHGAFIALRCLQADFVYLGVVSSLHSCFLGFCLFCVSFVFLRED